MFTLTAPTPVAKQADPNFRQLRAVLANLEPDMRRAVLTALKRLRGSVSVNALLRAIEQGTPLAVDAAIDWATLGASLLDELGPAQRKALQRGGELALRQQPAELGLSFEMDTPLARAWLGQHGAELVVSVTATTRDGIRAVTERMFAAETPIGTQQAAKQIREIIGLTPRQGTAVQNFRRALEENLAGERTLGSIRRRFGLTRDIRLPVEGLRQNQVDRLVGDYSDRWLTHRATVIAEQEAMMALSQGRDQAWQQFTEQGALDPTTDFEEWLVSPDDRTCDICLPMHGQLVPLGQPFTTGDGGQVRSPGEPHTGCRCDKKIVTAEELDRRPSAARRRTDTRIGELQEDLPEQPLAPTG